MTRGGQQKRFSWRSVEFKLPATLAMVVIITALGIWISNEWLARASLETMARARLQSSLDIVLYHYKQSGSTPTGVEMVLKRLSALFADPNRGFNRVALYTINGNGRVIIQSALKGIPLPTGQALKQIAALGEGNIETELGGRRGWLVFSRLKGSDHVVVLQALADDFIGPTLSTLRDATLLASIILVGLITMFAVVLAHRELSKPLKALTLEAERVSRGDLTPPKPLASRRDELGRLSVALSEMTQAAAEMVEQARKNQERFQRLFMDSRDAAFVIDRENRLVEVNPAAVKIFGFASRDEMLSIGSTESLFVDLDQRNAYLAEIRRQGYVDDHHLLMQRRNGEQFEALVTATAAGTHGGRFGLVRDVTSMLTTQRALKESEERQRRLLENAPDIIYRWSLNTNRFDFISPAVTPITGYHVQTILDNPRILLSCINENTRPAVIEQWEKLIRGQGPPILEQDYPITSRQGETRWVLEHSVLVRDEAGNPVAVEGVASDITLSKEVDKARRLAHRSLEATLAGLPAPVIVIDSDHRVRHWNRAMEQLTGVAASEMIGTKRQWEPFYAQQRPILADLLLDNDIKTIEKLYHAKGLKKSDFIRGGVEAEDFFPAIGGKTRHLYFLAAPITDEDGRVVQAVETLVDLSDRRKLEEELTRLSVTDELTGLYNRRFFYNSLNIEVEASRRHGHPLSLILMDLDRFKDYNDRYGHVEGDRVLVGLAAALRSRLRLTDLPCRYGGEEFVVLLPHTGRNEAEKVAERIRAAVFSMEFNPAANGEKKEGPIHIGVSVGVASLGEGQSAEDLVRQADVAMYHVKHNGGNRVGSIREDRQMFLFPFDSAH